MRYPPPVTVRPLFNDYAAELISSLELRDCGTVTLADTGPEPLAIVAIDGNKVRGFGEAFDRLFSSDEERFALINELSSATNYNPLIINRALSLLQLYPEHMDAMDRLRALAKAVMLLYISERIAKEIKRKQLAAGKI